MNYSEIIITIFQVCIIPLLGVLTTFLVKWLQIKSSELQNKMDNELADKYMTILTNTITECVLATNQTYVDALKQQNKFDLEAQKIAFEKTSEAVMNILTEDAKKYLESAVGDLELFIKQKIEAEVNLNKQKKREVL